MIAHLSTLPNVPQKAEQLLSHVVNAYDIWFARLHKKKQRFDLFAVRKTNENREAFMELREWFMEELIKYKDLEQVISYTSTEGKAYKSLRKEIYYHLVNHGNYHLAQINLVLSQNGLKPAVLDFIVYTRKEA